MNENTVSPQEVNPLLSGAAPTLNRTAQNSLRLKKRLIAVLGVTVFAVYAAMVSACVYPGVSACETAKAFALLPDTTASHPLWLLVARGIAGLFGTPLALNVFTALCAAGAVVLLFDVTHRVLFDQSRSQLPPQMIPVIDDHDQAADGVGNLVIAEDDKTYSAALLGGLFAALSFAFGGPFWCAATSLHPQPFDLFFFLAMADLLAIYFFDGKFWACIGAAFLAGALAIEWPVFLIFFPIVVVLLVTYSLRYEHFSESFLILMLTVGLAGVLTSLLLNYALIASVPGAAHLPFLHICADALRADVAIFFSGFPKNDWPFTVGVPILTLAIAIFANRQTAFCMDNIVLWKWRGGALLFSLVAFATLLNMPYTAWACSRTGSHLPVLPSLAIALSVGFFLDFWLRQTDAETFEADERSSGLFLPRMLACLMTGFSAFTVMCTIVLNYPDASAKKGEFADQTAREILRCADSSSVLVTGGLLDFNVLVQAHLAGVRIPLLPSEVRSTTSSAEKAKRVSTDLRLTISAPYGSPNWSVANQLSFCAKQTNSLLVSFDAPEALSAAGLLPLPNGLIYVGIASNAPVSLADMTKNHRDTWQRLEVLLKADPTPCRPALRDLHHALCAHVSRMANELGTRLDLANQPKEADEAYSAALSFDSDNLCAFLNRYALVVRQRKASEEGLQPELGQSPLFKDSALFSEALCKSMIAQYGTLLTQNADFLLPPILSANGCDQTVPPSLFKTLDHWFSLPQRNRVYTTRLSAWENVKGKTQETAHAVAAGERPISPFSGQQDFVSEPTVRQMLKKNPGNLSAMACLVEILVARGAIKEISDDLLHTMRASANLDDPRVAMAQGVVYLFGEPARFQDAQMHLRAAVDQLAHPGIVGSWLLTADQEIGDISLLEQDAAHILALDPDHPKANATLGHIHLLQKKYSAAEKLLVASIRSEPQACVFLDLAELRLQQNNVAEAEQAVRMAIRQSPCSHQAWETLGKVLDTRGRAKEAGEAKHCATVLLASTIASPRL